MPAELPEGIDRQLDNAVELLKLEAVRPRLAAGIGNLMHESTALAPFKGNA